MTKDEALKLALEALETTGAKSSDQWQKERKAITAIKQALAAPTVQEPVAWLYPEGLEALQNGKCWTAYPTKHDGCNIPLCAPPAAPVQEPIGYEKYAAIREGHRNACEEAYFGARPDLPLTTSTLKVFRHGFDRGYDIEGKQHRNEWLLKLQAEIKRLQSTTPSAQPAPTVQEPVYQIRYYENSTAWHDANLSGYLERPEKDRRILYTTPPTSPVPLTDEDVAILEAVRREMEDKVYSKNAPGHAHHTPGIWDEDNGDLAGKPCAWCLTWKKFTGLIEREAAHDITKGQT